MNSVAELLAIKEKMKNEVVLREGVGNVRVVVAMGTCGIASGARETLNAFVQQTFEAGLAGKVTVTQTGCIGNCEKEPTVEVFENGKDTVTYVNLTADKVKTVVEKHLVGGEPVAEFTAQKA